MLIKIPLVQINIITIEYIDKIQVIEKTQMKLKLSSRFVVHCNGFIF